MILEKLNLKKGLKLEIVDKDDIIFSYKNNKYVDSCMSRSGRWKYTRLYKYIKDLKLLRIMKGDNLVLRSLLWNVEDEEKSNFKLIDTVYQSKRLLQEMCDCGCGYRDYKTKIFYPEAYEQFKEIWPKYADVRRTAKKAFVKLLPNKVKVWPYMDTFMYYNPAKQLLSNAEDIEFKYYEFFPIELALDRGNDDIY